MVIKGRDFFFKGWFFKKQSKSKVWPFLILFCFSVCLLGSHRMIIHVALNENKIFYILELKNTSPEFWKKTLKVFKIMVAVTKNENLSIFRDLLCHWRRKVEFLTDTRFPKRSGHSFVWWLEIFKPRRTNHWPKTVQAQDVNAPTMSPRPTDFLWINWIPTYKKPLFKKWCRTKLTKFNW